MSRSRSTTPERTARQAVPRADVAPRRDGGSKTPRRPPAARRGAGGRARALGATSARAGTGGRSTASPRAARGGPRRRPAAPRRPAPASPATVQRRLDLLGLALMAVAVFLVFPLYLDWRGGALGDGLVTGLRAAVGGVAVLVPPAAAVGGLLLVLRPVLPTLRPFRTGGLLLLGALVLGLAAGTLGLGPETPRLPATELPLARERGGLLGGALYAVTRTLVADVGTHVLVVTLLLAAVLVLTGASVASVLGATGRGLQQTTTVLRRLPDPREVARREPRGRDPVEPEDLRHDVPPGTAADGGPGAAKGGPGAAGGGDARAGTDPSGGTAAAAAVDGPFAAPEDLAVPGGAARLDGAARFPDLFDDPAAPVRVRRRRRGKDVEDAQDPDARAAAGDGGGGADPESPDADPGLHPPAPQGAEPPAARPASGADAPSAPDEHRGEPLFLLPDPRSLTVSSAEQLRPDTAGQAETAQTLVEALSHFNVAADVVGTVAGPHITRYELKLAPGIKMSKVAQLGDDLAYALAATDIRILAPIPGKQAVGVEVPNKRRRVVHLGDVLGRAPEDSSPLVVWLGKDVAGRPVHADLAKMPHLLVAGTTGAGKSGAVNAMLTSILLRATPKEVRLVLVDPKQVELNHYESVPHLLTPVITSPKKAANALQNLVREMEWRYGVMAMKRTRSLPELNRVRVEEGDEALPYVLCVIDELADLMMIAPADVEDAIIRIAQKARAVGIHLVLATQSPRVDVITGMIKANVPSRIAFSVSSQTDSRVILDQNGAESLLGRGDLLFSPVGTSRLQRIQGAYVDEAEIAQITGHWAAQGAPDLREDLLDAAEEEPAAGGAPEPEEHDPLLADAVEIVVEMGAASTSGLQRRLRVGYTRAGRLVDMMERRGVVGPYEGSKARPVLMGPGDVQRLLGELRGGAAEGPPEGEADAEAVLPPPEPTGEQG